MVYVCEGARDRRVSKPCAQQTAATRPTIEALLGTNGNGAVLPLPAFLARTGVWQGAVPSVRALPVLHCLLLGVGDAKNRCVDAPSIMDVLHRLLAYWDAAICTFPAVGANALVR